jgi:hypothetical protein
MGKLEFSAADRVWGENNTPTQNGRDPGFSPMKKQSQFILKQYCISRAQREETEAHE